MTKARRAAVEGRRLWHETAAGLCSVALLLVVAEAGAGLLLRAFPDPDPLERSDVLRGEPWARAYLEELKASRRSEHAPYLGYRRVPGRRGRFINLDADSRRLTTPCARPASSPAKIFVFGGSTVWGTGARDDGTIPSFLSQALCGAGLPVKVFNFGESGYTSTQQVIQLLLELRRGNVPRVALFYSGANDVFASFQNGVAGLPDNMDDRVADHNTRLKLNLRGAIAHSSLLRLIQRPLRDAFLRKTWGRATPAGLSEETFRVYAGNVALVRALAREYGFTPLFYWQPSVFTKAALSPSEKELPSAPALRALHLEVTRSVRGLPGVTDLSGLFDAQAGPVFLEHWHVGERANEAVARRMLPDVRAALARRGGGR